MKILFPKIFIFISFFLALALSRQVLAIDTSQITFPVAELSNCTDATSCKTYCSQTVNYGTCKAFAASHREKIVTEAKDLLGCTSYESCKKFCQQIENRQRCLEFAKREKPNLSPDVVTAFFEATRLELGCDSQTSCKSFCDLPENFTRCTLFAKRHNLFRYRPGPLVATPSSYPKPPSLPPVNYPPTRQ